MKIFDILRERARSRPKRALMFGPAATALPTGARVLMANPAFRSAYLEASKFVEAHRGWSLEESLHRDLPPSGVSASERNFVEETVLQLCMARALFESGVEFDTVAGVSLGDAAAGFASGALTFEETLLVMCETIGAVLSATGGDLVAVQAEPARVIEIIDAGSASMIFDWPVLSVWAVPDEYLKRMQKKLRIAGVAYVRLGFNCLSHTDRVDARALTQAISSVGERQPARTYYSTLEGGVVYRGAIPRDRWARAISEPVRLTDMWRRMRDDGYTDLVYAGSVPAEKDLFGSLPESERPSSFTRAETLIALSSDDCARDISVHVDNAPKSIANVFGTAEFARDPYPFYRQWLSESSVHKLPDEDFFVVLGYDAAVAVLKQPAVFSNRPFLTLSPILPGADAPLHTRIRRVLNPYFTRERAMESASSMREIATAAVDSLRSRKSFDAVNDFASPVSFAISCMILGVHQAAAAALGPMRAEDVTWQDVEIAIAGDGVITHLIDQGEFSREDIQQVLPFLIGAGTLTVRDTASFAMLTLDDQREVLQALVGNQSRIAPFIEELFRYEPGIHGMLRQAVTDTVIDNVEIPAGSNLWVWVGAANRDPARFSDPDEFIVGRSEKHIAFGAGPHFCLGSHFARTEIQVMLEAIVPELCRLRTRHPPDFYFTSDLHGGNPAFPFMRGIRSWELEFTVG